jgi:hypothetical protein
VVQYKKGTLNLVADALSRKEDSKDGELLTAVTEIIPQWIEDLALSYEGDRWAFEVLQQHKTGTLVDTTLSVHKGIIRVKGKLYVGTNQEWRNNMIQAVHDRWAFRNFGNISENEEHILLVRNEGSKMLLIL